MDRAHGKTSGGQLAQADSEWLAQVEALVTAVFENQAQTDSWLTSANAALGGITPRSLAVPTSGPPPCDGYCAPLSSAVLFDPNLDRFRALGCQAENLGTLSRNIPWLGGGSHHRLQTAYLSEHELRASRLQISAWSAVVND